MISAVISLICENSLAVLTTAKPLPPIIPIQFYSLVYGTVSHCDQVLLSQHALSQKRMMFHNKIGYLPSEKAGKFYYVPRINFDGWCEHISWKE